MLIPTFRCLVSPASPASTIDWMTPPHAYMCLYSSPVFRCLLLATYHYYIVVLVNLTFPHLSCTIGWWSLHQMCWNSHCFSKWRCFDSSPARWLPSSLLWVFKNPPCNRYGAHWFVVRFGMPNTGISNVWISSVAFIRLQFALKCDDMPVDADENRTLRRLDPIHVACRCGHTSLLLRKLSPDGTMSEKFDKSRFHSLQHSLVCLAVEGNHPECVKLLLDQDPALINLST